MSGLKKIILGISDIKALFQSINKCYSIDFSNFAMSSFKFRVEEFMFNYRLSSIDDLIYKTEADRNFFQLLMNNLLVDTTEMFRDPDFWGFFKVQVLHRINSNSGARIWIPECNSGDELYTLKIILHELGLDGKFNIVVSTLNKVNVERISSACVDPKKMETNVANYERYLEEGKLLDYFSQKSNMYKLNYELLEKVEIIEHNLFKDKIPSIFDIVLFRNKMLYYNPTLKIEALKIINSALKPGGFLALGIKETCDYPGWELEYDVINESERIFKKILTKE
ncbi:MAG: CheR family methyltransferase [Bacteroidales bacterium]